MLLWQIGTLSDGFVEKTVRIRADNFAVIQTTNLLAVIRDHTSVKLIGRMPVLGRFDKATNSPPAR